MGILSKRNGHKQQWRGFKSTRNNINSECDTIVSNISDKWHNNNRNSNKFLRQFRLHKSNQFHNNKSRRILSIYANIFRTWHDQSNGNPESDYYKKRNRYNKYFYSVAACIGFLSPNLALAEGVGGVSATANPIANSSGSVTNQAIQVLQGPYITNTYGGGVSCQGSTLNITPYLQFADSRKHPWEDFYDEPQYNLTDIEGRTVQQTITVKNYPWESWYDTRTKEDGSRWFEDGDDMEITIDVPAGDGVPDAVSNNSLEPTWFKPIRTDMKANQSFNAGVSATLSIPLNKKLREQCEIAAQAQINHQVQLTSNKRLDFELARLKNCGELKKAGVFFHPKSPYHAICADVVVTAPGGTVMPHTHNLPKPNWVDPTSTSSQEVNLSTDGTGLKTIQIGTISEESSQTSSGS